MSQADGHEGTEDELRAEIVRLRKVVRALMDRSERESGSERSDFGLTQATIILEAEVRERTRQLEETRNQLIQSEKMASIGQLAAGVAHEINNPIAFVYSNLSTLGKYAAAVLGLLDAYDEIGLEGESARRAEEAKRMAGLERLREDLPALIEESIEGVARVRAIIMNLRDFSRTGDTAWQETDLVACIEATLSLMESEIRAKAELRREYGALPAVECIPSQMKQAFLNLFRNAAAAISGRGTITVRTGLEGEEAWVSISDTGAGIPKESLSRIFDPFFTTRPVGQGPGLGLSVVYGIMKAHGGCVEVSSAVGSGSTFTLRLPLRRKGEGR
jgi:two-component system, NtrC family, sensor kinase